MAILKCKMCGGDLTLIEGQSLAECEYCGSRQTVPAADNEKKLTLFARANRLRAACEFDRATGIYETIVADFPEEAEAYWGLILCKYGIEYVDDPATGKKIPTCHRSSFERVMDDTNYEQVLKHADALAKSVYAEEAKQLEEIREGIIAVSANEEPYDIFICYKETDHNGERTLDSVLAQDIYDALTNKGYRTFFARISLEDKLGQEYEPYIFAALNSAKIMLAIGTDYQYFDAVWVKNEWSRFLKLMTTDKSKHLIPCYKGIDAYDMPKEFQHLQGQDLGKMGAIQDLLRGVGKIIDVAPATTTAQSGNTTAVIIDTMLKRAADALAAKDWDRATRCYDNVQDYDEGNEDAMIGRILIHMKASSLTELEETAQSIASNSFYKYLVQNGSKTTADKMRAIEERIQANIREKAEAEAKRKKKKTKLIATLIFSVIAIIALAIGAYYVNETIIIPGNAYKEATALLENGQYDAAAEAFIALQDYKDSANRASDAYMAKVTSFAEKGNYAAALSALEEPYFAEVGISVDDLKNDYTYCMAMNAYESKDYQAAVSIFEQVPGYKNADDRLIECRYTLADMSYQSGDYDTAIEQFKSLGDYQNGSERALQIAYETAQMFYQQGNLDQAIKYYSTAEGYQDAADQVVVINYEAGTQAMVGENYVKAVEYFNRVRDYQDSADQILKAKFQYCKNTAENPDDTTKAYIKELKNAEYKGSAALYEQIFAWKASVRAYVSLRIGMQTGVSFEAALSGGDGTSTKVKFVAKVNGQTHTYCDNKLYAAGDKPSCQFSGMTDVTKWKYNVTVYDGDGNKIGSFSGVPED